jgi:hypothetical protein
LNDNPFGVGIRFSDQKSQDFVWHDRLDILLPEPFIDPGQKQAIVLDRIFSPSLTFENQ